MAKNKQRATSDICADCGALEPTWASVNRAILLCDECCSIHRSLGRHISQVKSIHKSAWNPNLLNMVQTLNENGANSIWEHSLLDPSNSKINRRKPQPKDPLHPVKADFIKTKHQLLAFVLRPSKEEFCSEEELNRQLHSSVRTSNLETSLRLLAQGADPNYFFKEKGTAPLHVAARAGQTLQIELLIANGGNPSIFDTNNQTPAEIAKMSGHLDLFERLLECMYEVTDRLTFFLCSRKPDHKSNEHLIIPEWADNLERSELACEARSKLQMLPNNLLEELAMDVYDEVDRRETDAVWLSSSSVPDQNPVPFLPVNPQLSSTRNQGRQKLARFTPKEFTTLILDILIEASYRHKIAICAPLQDPAIAKLRKEHHGKHGSQMSDDEPLYDSVASDDDYGTLSTDNHSQSTENCIAENDKSQTQLTKGLSSMVEVLKKQLAISETTVKDMTKELESLRVSLDHVTLENRELKQILLSQNKLTKYSEKMANGHRTDEKNSESEPVLDAKTTMRSLQRPASMYETREGPRKSPMWNKNQVKQEQDNFPRLWENQPNSEEVTRRTEQVTKRIQELWRAMQDPSQREVFVPCADRIRVAVSELASIFPQNSHDDTIRSALRQLNGNTGRLQAECAGLQRCTSDPGHMERCLQQVRSCAYDIAKATKLIVTQFHVV